MKDEDSSCWVCRSRRSSEWKSRSIDRPLKPSDLQITDSRYGATLGLRRCSECGFIQASAKEISELEALYERLEDPGYEETQDTRALQMRWLLRLTVRKAPETKTWLDIGAGGGLLVAEARALGLKALGVEPSHSLVELAKRVNGVDILQGVFPHPALSGQTFDVISLVDVIEHVSDPVGLLKSVGRSLSDEGLILCVTPDVGSLLARLLGRRWWHFRLAHVGYFNRKTLEMAANEAGLDVKHWIRARWFFRVEYLADRLAEYVPIGPINRWAMKAPFLARIYRMVIPLDLKDSWVVVLGKPAPENKTP